MNRLKIIIPLVAVTVAASGCGRRAGETETPSAPAAPAATTSPLAGVFTDVAAPAALPPIPELRQNAKPGDAVVFDAKVMGTDKPFVDNRAVFVVGDEGTMTSCDTRHGDQCATPWDNCCDDSEVIRAGTATIQVVDGEGKVLRQGIKDISGLKELSRVRIAGEVAPNSTEAAFIINATGIQLR